jgi:hypothetical protein
MDIYQKYVTIGDENLRQDQHLFLKKVFLPQQSSAPSPALNHTPATRGRNSALPR